MNKTIKSFVLRRGHITPAQERALAEHAQYIIPWQDITAEQLKTYLPQKDVVLEVGFGMGLATYQIAQEHQEMGFLGMEVHAAGVGKLLLAIHEHDIKNLYIVNDDATQAIPKIIADNSLAGVHCFYPDPWPKKRHHKRRLLQAPFIRLLATKLRPGGYLYIVTDWQEYAEEILTTLNAEPLLVNTYDDYADLPNLQLNTRFREKASAAGRASWALWFERRI